MSQAKFDEKELAEELRVTGFTVVPALITASQCEELRTTLDGLYEQHAVHYATTNAEAGSLASKVGEKVVYNLHNKSKAFWPLFTDPVVTSVIGARLREGSWAEQEPFYLNNISARSPNPGNTGQTLHVDSNIPGLNHSLFINALWCIDDFSLTNGTTLVVPGSHHRTNFPTTNASQEEVIAVEAPLGSVIIFDGSLWHAGSARPVEATGSRWGVVLGYARWWIKPSFDTARNTPNALWGEMDENLKRMLGFDSIPPISEFHRVRRRSETPEEPFGCTSASE